MEVIYQIPSLDANNVKNNPLVLDCSGVTSAVTVTMLSFLSTTLQSPAAVCDATPITYVNCEGYSLQKICTGGPGPGNVQVTIWPPTKSLSPSTSQQTRSRSRSGSRSTSPASPVSRSRSASALPSRSPTPNPFVFSPRPQIIIPLPTTPSRLPNSISFSQQYIFQVPELSLNKPIRIDFTCDKLLAGPTTLTLLDYLTSPPPFPNNDVCSVVDLKTIRCENFIVSPPICTSGPGGAGSVQIVVTPINGRVSRPGYSRQQYSRFFPNKYSRMVFSKYNKPNGGGGHHDDDHKKPPVPRPPYWGGGGGHKGGDDDDDHKKNGGGYNNGGGFWNPGGYFNGGRNRNANQGNRYYGGGGKKDDDKRGNGGYGYNNGGFGGGYGGYRNGNGGHGGEGKKKNNRKRDDIVPPSPKNNLERAAVDDSMAVEYSQPTSAEGSNNAYYALLALVPVVMAAVGFLVWRHKRSFPENLQTFEFQPEPVSIAVIPGMTPAQAATVEP